jgi:antirestriction protein ArdC
MGYSIVIQSNQRRLKMNNKVAQIVADQIIAKIETEQLAPWQKSWVSKEIGLPRNGVSNKVYKGWNLFVLVFMSENPYWFTYKQAKELGGNVKTGSKSVPIIYWNWIEKGTGEFDENNKEKTKKVPFLRYYNVFNATQCEGLPEKFYPIADPLKIHDVITEAQAIVDAMPNRPQLLTGNSAFYTPALDTVTTPALGSFNKAEDFYSTMFHELAHSTGHGTRLNRKGVTNHDIFGSHQYGQEELVAEFTASFLCYHAGILTKTIDTSASYLKGWMERIKEDPTMLIYSAQQAQKATDYIMGTKEEDHTEEKVD